MASYNIIWLESARRDFQSIPKNYREHILEKAALLGHNPRPVQSKKLKGQGHAYRLRMGNYRIVYTIDDKLKSVEIFGVGDRKDVYRNF